MALICSWITIIVLLKEKYDNSRPYLQISMELIRSNLACIVIRNVGEVPLTITQINFNQEFIKQLPELEKENLSNNKITNLQIFPQGKWVFCLGVIIPEILEKFELTQLQIEYSYKKINGSKIYKENTTIDFKQYSKLLVYISEIDELKNETQKIVKSTEKINRNLADIKQSIVKYQTIDNKVIKTIANGYTKEKE